MGVAVTRYKNFVGGELVESAAGETMEVLNPATGETIAEVPRGTADDVERAVAAARKAAPAWGERPPKERMEALLKLADVIEENADELAQLESQNVGKPMSIAGDEMPFCADNLRFFAGAARRSRARPRPSTSRGTRPSSAASRSGSSPGSRPGTTR